LSISIVAGSGDAAGRNGTKLLIVAEVARHPRRSGSFVITYRATLDVAEDLVSWVGEPGLPPEGVNAAAPGTL